MKKHLLLLLLFGVLLRFSNAQDVINFDGQTNPFIQTNTQDSIPLLTGDFTIEFYFNYENEVSYPQIFAFQRPSNDIIYNNTLWINGDVLEVWDGQTLVIKADRPMETCSWYHIAYVWNSTDTIGTLYMDGQAVGTQTVGAVTPGLGLAFSPFRVNCQYEEMRFSDMARYTEDFTRPQMAFEPDSNTVFLYNMNDTLAEGVFPQRITDSSGNGYDALFFNDPTTFSEPFFATAVDVSCAGAGPFDNMADVISKSSQLTTLEVALTEAGLLETFQGEGPLTLFAPTDAAFEAVDSATLAALLADPSGSLTRLLTYHVVDGAVSSDALSDGQIVTTINGIAVEISISGTDIFINDALITQKDVQTTNGIIHIIDAVLVAPTIADVVAESDQFNILESALVGNGLIETFQNDGTYTVFAPTDDAFAAIDPATVAALLENPTAVLTYHVLDSIVRAADLMDGQVFTTLNGKDINISIQGDSVFINNALVTMTDIETGNGVVHVIDAVLNPPRITVADIVVASEEHTTLETALGAAGLVETLQGDGPFTVFAPTDEAFAAVDSAALAALLADPMGELAKVLTYHVVEGTALSSDLMDGQEIMTVNGKDITVSIQGDSVFINDALVTMADVETDNGVVHVIDAVLLPPRITVADIVIESEVHNTLETALATAGLVETLQGDGPFTVFAPTDEAFAAIDSATLAAVLADTMGLLTDILTYHVVEGTALSSDLMDGQEIMTINGKDITVSIQNDSVFINDALVTMADVETDNGVVHIIDAVLLPPRITVADIVLESDAHHILEVALENTGLMETLDGDGPFTVFAPTDDAFGAIDSATLAALVADPASVLTYHVAEGQALSTDLSDGQTVMTVNGKNITVSIQSDSIFINDALVTMADIETDNGVVHVIDAVLLPPRITVADVVVESDVHNTLEFALGEADFVEALQGDGPFTLFAPTDEAFAAVDSATLAAVLADPAGLLTDILTYHVVEGKALSTDLMDGQMVMTLNGQDVTVSIQGDSIFINDALVTMKDIEVDNGVVHVIDAVLLPARVTVADVVINSDDHNTLEFALGEAGLVDALQGDGPFTVFAPTDEAFAAVDSMTLAAVLADPEGLLTDILTYHVVEGKALSTDLMDGQEIMTLNGKDITVTLRGENIFINDALVTMKDIEVDNGVVHVIDLVLLPPRITVADIIIDSEVHTTLETALDAADLVETLEGDGPFTVFAPTDAAFAAVDSATLASLLADPMGDLTTVLLYHVVGDLALSTDLSDGQNITTLNDQDVIVSIQGDSVLINEALVVMKDIETDNGVVHVIDGVLIPELSNVPTITESGIDIEVFPNPASEILNININDRSIERAEMVLWNAAGQKMLYRAVNLGNNRIEVGGFAPGMYFLEFRIDNQRLKKALIINR
ncbi:MAG: fasciclin domain-containing protein [Bacteroidota bacterium]